MEKKIILTLFTLAMLVFTSVNAQTDCELSCPPEDVVLNVDDQGDFTVPDFFLNGTIGFPLACQDGDFSQIPVPGTALDTGTYEISVQLEFEGQSTSCVFNLVVSDGNQGGGKCVIVCPETYLVEADTSQSYTLPNFFEDENIFLGDCELSNFTQSPEEGTAVFADSTEVFLNYTVGGDAESCNFTLILDNVSGVFDFEEVALTVYPNPATNRVSIQSETRVEGIALYDITGKKVFTSALPTFDVSAMAKGLYFLEIAIPSGKVLRRLVVE